MTVIAAYYTDPQNYAMAADSGVTFGTVRGQPVDKLYRWGPIFFGLAGGWGICQEGARYLLGQPGSPPANFDALAHQLLQMCAHLTPKVGPPPYNQGNASIGLSLLAVAPWGIVELDCGSGLHPTLDAAAIGTGGLPAAAAMWAAFRFVGHKARPLDMVMIGVEAAVRFDSGCHGSPSNGTISTLTRDDGAIGCSPSVVAGLNRARGAS